MAEILGYVIIGTITVADVVVFLALMAISSWQAQQAKRAARDAFNASLKDRLVMVASTTGYRSRVYGRVRNVDGVLFKATHGADSRYFTLVVACAGHEIDGFEQAYFGDIPLTLDGQGWVQTRPFLVASYETHSDPVTISGGVGIVVASFLPIAGTVFGATLGGSGQEGYWPVDVTSLVGNTVTVSSAVDGLTYITYQTQVDTSKARVRFYTGAAGQDLSGDLIALGIPNVQAAVHRFAGIACMLVTLTFDTDAFHAGVPQCSARVRGARCYDRRTGVTAWTRNPAVIAEDWATLLTGGAIAAADLASDLLIASANACDVTHSFNKATLDGITVAQVMPMYTCDIVCHGDANPSDILSAIVESMAGQWGWASGRLRIKAGFYTGPVVTIDETWISDQGARVFNQGLPLNELVNVYTAQISDADSDYMVVPVAPVRAQVYIDSDGRELPLSVVLEGVSDVVHAQHILGVLLRHSRQGFTVSLPLNFKGIVLELFDTVAVTLARFGLLNKIMEVTSWSFSQDGGTLVTLRESSAGIYDPDALFQLLDESPNTTLPLPWIVPDMTGLVVTSGTAALTDKSIVTRTRVVWDAVPSESVQQSGKVDVTWLELGANPPGEWATQSVPGSDTELVIVGLKGGSYYLFMVRARNSTGSRGRWTHHVFVKIALPPPADVAAALAAANAAQASANAAQATANQALAGIAAAVDDNLLAPSEKASIVLDVNVLNGEYSGIYTQALAYGVTSTSVIYQTALNDLNAYLLTIPGWNVIPGVAVAIVGTAFRAKFQSVYTTKQSTLNAIAAAAKVLADAAQAKANAADAAAQAASAAAAVADGKANAASTAATNAQAAANAALTELQTISSDNVLSVSEKSAVIVDWTAIWAEAPGINAQATALGITTEQTAYSNAVNALSAYLGSLGPWPWSDITPGHDTTIVGATFRNNFTTLYSNRQTLLNKIADVLKAQAAAALYAANNIDTPQILPNAVTLPIAVHLSADVVCPANAADNTLLTVGSMNTLGNPMSINMVLDCANDGGAASVTYTISLRIGAVTVWALDWTAIGGLSAQQVLSAALLYTPPTGVVTVTVHVQANAATVSKQFRLRTQAGTYPGTTVSVVGLKR